MQRFPTWAWFLVLGVLWGSSYFWIKVGIESLPPLTLIAGRLVLGGLFLAAVVGLAREPLPRQARMYGHLLVLGVVSIVLPFVLITVGEQSIDSALAAILNSTVPLGVIVIAPFVLPDERVTPGRIAGLAIGFVGVIVLVAPDLVNLSDADLTGELMMLGSSLSYAVGAVYARRNVHGLRPMIPALFQVAFAAAIVVPLALLVDDPVTRLAPAPGALVAVVWLGLLGSGFAYLCYFTILRAWGATRTSTVSYLLPVVGIAMGTLLGEAITVERVAGTLLIFGGIALVNRRGALGRRTVAPSEAPAEG